MWSNSSVVKRPDFSKTLSRIPILPISCRRAPVLIRSSSFVEAPVRASMPVTMSATDSEWPLVYASLASKADTKLEMLARK